MIPKIAFRHIRSGHRFGFISFTSILSIIGLMLGVASLNVISSFSSGFSNSIQHKLASLDGHLRITKYQSDSGEILSGDEIKSIQAELGSVKNLLTLVPYIEKKAIIRSGRNSEGVIVYGVPEKSLIEIFNLDDLIIDGNLMDFNKGMIVGTGLAKSLESEVDKSVFLFDIQRYINEGITKGEKLHVSGVFKSGFSEYDKLLVFLSLEKARSFFEVQDGATGLIGMLSDPLLASQVDEEVINILGFSPYVTSTWLERHSMLFNWLNIYDLPIKLVIGFIIIIAVFNIAAILWMTIKEKTSEVGILTAIGFSGKQIRSIFLIEGLLIGVIGSVSGLILSVVVLVLQMKFKFISLSSDIYFVDFLPVDWSINHIFIYPGLAILLSVMSAYFPARWTKRINPVEAIRYE
ncbi:MAG: ABC transporter permease [Candidatus Marinimicrobia bacterium]|nr:ABC transporter permease [Candidatus Neomarinimicrobiota bacterium]